MKLSALKRELNGMFVVCDKTVHSLYAAFLPSDCFLIDSSEQKKCLKTVELIAREMQRRGIKRSGCLAAVGGGITGDIAGFAAAIYMRGIDWIYIPTTLLSMADSSVGGKTGVNLRGIKNALGAFHSPRAVLLCHEFLKSLPSEELDSGMGEIIKTGLLDKNLFGLINKNAPIEELIAAARGAKQRIISEDFLDTGIRRSLNIGHTVGHAIESVYGIRHGISVAMGLRIEQIFAKNSDLKSWIDTNTQNLIPHNVKLDVKKLTFAAKNDKKNSEGISVVIPIEIERTKEINLSLREFKEGIENYDG